MKRVWVIVIAAVLVLIAVGVIFETTTGVINFNSTPQTVTVEFWHTFGDAKRSNWIQARADDYNKAHPGVKVVPSYKGDSNTTFQATILGARQGQVPALVHVEGTSTQLALDSNVFQPVSSIKNVDFSDYLKPVISYYTVGGKVNSVPFNASSPVLYFNKDLMQKVGLDPNNPPTTFGAILDACAKFDAAKLGIKCVALTPYALAFRAVDGGTERRPG